MVITAADITCEWLSARFRARGHRCQLHDVRVSRSLQARSGTVYFIEMSGSPGALRFLVLKTYRRDWFRFGLNEGLFYENFCSDPDAVPAPDCHDFYVDDDTEYCHVLTTDLTPTHKMCDRRRLRQQYRPVVRALARLHARWWEREELSRDVMLVPQGGTVSMIQATTRAAIEHTAHRILDELLPAFCRKFHGQFSNKWRRLLEAAADAWPTLYGERIVGRRRLTLLHGDANWENIFLPRSPGGEVRLIDWETFKCGPGAYDVAYLLISARGIEQRREIERRVLDWYLESLAQAGVNGYTHEDVLADYRLSVVANLFVALAWGRLSAMHDSMSAFLDWDGPLLVGG